MSRHFGSLGEMALFLAARPAEIALELHHGLEQIGERVEATARAEFGHYQDEAGPFPGWPELADATKDDRVSKGFPENEPLLRTGETRDSMSHHVDNAALDVVIGSTDEKMPWFEFGTSRMPARPVVGPAAFRNKLFIQRKVGEAVVVGLVGGELIHEALGYGIKTQD